MAGENSVQRFTDPSKKETQDTQGITAFEGDGVTWNQIIGGLHVQGGRVSAAGAVSFPAKFQTQLLGIFCSAGTPSSETTSGFTASAACYWFAIGV